MRKVLRRPRKKYITKRKSRKEVFSSDKREEKMGVKHGAIDQETGEMLLPKTSQRRSLKRITSKKRRRKERYLLKRETLD